LSGVDFGFAGTRSIPDRRRKSKIQSNIRCGLAMGELVEKFRIAFTGKLASMTRKEAWRLVRELGAEPVSNVSHLTSILVVGMEGWPLLPDGEISHKLKRAQQLRAAGCGIKIETEPGFLELIGQARSNPESKPFPAPEVCRIMKIDRGALRRWEQLGLVRADHGFYDFQDLLSIQTIHTLVGDGVRLERIARSLRDLSAILPGMERPLAQLRIIAGNQDLLVHLGGARFSTSGQMLFDFEIGRPPKGSVLPLNMQARDSAEWFELGLSCEEEGLFSEAAQAFRSVLAMKPDSVEAYFHLGNVMCEMGIMWAAEEFYSMAAELDHGNATVLSCLAGIQEQLGKTAEAISNYQAAVGACPDFAEGHFSLALCYEKAGRKLDACRHWFAYLKLDPGSAAATVAKQHLHVPPHSS